MRTRSSLSGTTTTHLDAGTRSSAEEVVELHWMREPDLAMSAEHALSAPALCGAWMEADEPSAAEVTSGGAPAQVVSCLTCDLLAALS